MNRKNIIAALTKLGIQFDASASNAVLNGLLKASWLQCRVRNDAGDGEMPADYDFELTINGQIGTDYYGDQGYSAKQFQDELKPLKGKRGVLNIHSGGGNVWDGFAIAEEDLRLRGGGEMLGTRQSGLPEFRLADLSCHGELLAAARDDAALILARDPDLKTPRGDALRVLLYLFERDAAVRTLRSG